MRLITLCLALCFCLPVPLAAQDGLGLRAPDEVVESGLLKHILPRFSLKTGIRVTASPDGAMTLQSDGTGTPVIQRGDTIYSLTIGDDPGQVRFQDWLLSEIGIRTIESFAPADGIAFTAPEVVEVVDEDPFYGGDPVEGETLSLSLCGRCHVIGPQNAMNSIGSTPSFAVLRAMSTWAEKFEQFFILRPHGAFTQIPGVTAPFDPERPSPIVPVELTLEDLDAIMAYVAQVEPADLGAPLQLQ